MSIKEKHLLRTQKLTLIVFSIITLFSFLGIMAQKANAGLPEWQNNTPLALVLLAYVSSFVVYKKNRGKEFYGRFVMIVYLVAYASMLLISASNTTYPYMIALLITIVISLDKTAVRIGTIGFVVINVLKVVMMLASAAVPTDVLENVMVETIITVIIAISCFMGRKILEQLLNESTDEIQTAADKQAELTASVLSSIKRIEVENDSNVNAVEAIAVSAETINSAMNDIAAGTVDTADAIQKQNTMTQDITEIIEETGTKTGAVTEMTKATMEALEVGTEAMSTLVSAVEAAITSGAAMKESAEKLESKTDEVKEITSIILNISGQTNLLALNASIEAARAGEAGRGFAVVADEIRKLAEQTKSATENIADILEELVADARTVSQKVDENVELSNEENEMAEKANAEFAQIKELVEDMTGQIGEVSEMMGRLSEANDVISENVTTLSASSEEISASAENTFDESKKNVAMVSEFKASMEAIAAEVRKLAELA